MKNENGIFGIGASRGFRKIIICQIFGEKMTIFNAQKHFQRSCQFEPFPLRPVLGSIAPPPPPPVENLISPEAGLEAHGPTLPMAHGSGCAVEEAPQ